MNYLASCVNDSIPSSIPFPLVTFTDWVVDWTPQLYWMGIRTLGKPKSCKCSPRMKYRAPSKQKGKLGLILKKLFLFTYALASRKRGVDAVFRWASGFPVPLSRRNNVLLGSRTLHLSASAYYRGKELLLHGCKFRGLRYIESSCTFITQSIPS